MSLDAGLWDRDYLVVAAGEELGRSALHEAAFRNDAALAVETLERRGNPAVQDADGLTPLHFAAQEWSVEVAEFFSITMPLST